MQKQAPIHGDASQPFIQKYSDRIRGVLSGFDRLRLRGTLRQLYCPRVMEAYLSASGILLKDFKHLVQATSDAVKAKAQELAAKAGRPHAFIPSSSLSKEGIAREIARKDKIATGLITVLSATEPCVSFTVRPNAQTKFIEIKVERRKCTHLYFYYDHARFGFMHVRLQTWFPFRVDVCLNGRHWLARQLDEQKIAYQKKENTFVDIADFAKAQTLLDEQLQTDWPTELNKLLKEVHPLHRSICRPLDLRYYWSASETEYATDLAFRDSESLAELYPGWTHHAISSFGSPDVMRFLGRYVPASTGRVYGQFDGEIISDLKRRAEGVRVKHSVNGNSIKCYDKQSLVLRVETTIVHPEQFKSYRKPEGQPKAKKRHLPLRRGLADMKRRAEVSKAANQRYLGALASTSAGVPLVTAAAKICKPVRKRGQRARALNPWSHPESQLLTIINRGEFVLNGFRNRDIRDAFYKPSRDSKQNKRRTAWICRRLRLFRMHGLIRKISGTHRYVVTPFGRDTITALMAARRADVQQLTKLAA